MEERLTKLQLLELGKVNKLNIACLSTWENARDYSERLSERLSAVLPNTTDVNTLWNQYHEIIKNVAETTIGYQPPPKKNPWYDDECAILKREMENARLQMLRRKKRASAVS